MLFPTGMLSIVTGVELILFNMNSHTVCFAFDCLRIIENALKEKEQFEDLVGMDLASFSKAVDINGLIEDAKKNENKLKALEMIENL